MDDNGNTFVVVECEARADAEARVKVLEDRGHKQVYYVDVGGALAAGVGEASEASGQP